MERGDRYRVSKFGIILLKVMEVPRKIARVTRLSQTRFCIKWNKEPVPAFLIYVMDQNAQSFRIRQTGRDFRSYEIPLPPEYFVLNP